MDDIVITISPKYIISLIMFHFFMGLDKDILVQTLNLFNFKEVKYF